MDSKVEESDQPGSEAMAEVIRCWKLTQPIEN